MGTKVVATQEITPKTYNFMGRTFLDVLVKEPNTSIITDIYYKNTQTHKYLHFGSCHPHNTKPSIPYNLARGMNATL